MYIFSLVVRYREFFFRQALKVIAKKNNVMGWVRNLIDKRVEAILEGDSKSINLVVEWAKIGPANSHVDLSLIHI